MMKNIFGEEVVTRQRRRVGSQKEPKEKGPRSPRKPRAVKVEGLGCAHCPLDKVRGINKVINIDLITGKKAMLWAQSPGKLENAEKQELIGPSGDFLWTDLKEFGLSRQSFDIQNVLRCYPKFHHEDKEHTPTTKELRCCSIFNPQALEKNQQKAVVHLILGEIAGKQLLKKDYRKDRAIFWYEPWNAYVVTASHPSYLLRLGGKKGWAYFTFLDRLKAVSAVLKHPGRYGYLHAQNYGVVETPEEMAKLKDLIYERVAKKERIVLDIEDGTVDGKKVPLVIGFGWGKYLDSPKDSRKSNSHRQAFAYDTGKKWEGGARSVVLYHPEADHSPKRLKPILRMLKEIIEDPKVKKILQNGVYDKDGLRNLLGWNLRGYIWDTQYSMYLKHPNLRSFALDKLIQFCLPEFADYKTEMLKPWIGGVPRDKVNYALVPLKTLTLYNCADCDSTKRLEQRSEKISYPLLQIYIHCAPVLKAMEPRGPFLDFPALDTLAPLIHERVTYYKRQLDFLSGGFVPLKKGPVPFNPNTPAHIAWLLYDKLKLPKPVDQHTKKTSRSTAKGVMDQLMVQTRSPAPLIVNEYRSWFKLEGTYFVGYRKSAEKHHGRLKTIWHLTGAVTGRLRSGKSDKAEVEEGIVNLQNISNTPLLQNLIVSDPKWRIAL